MVGQSCSSKKTEGEALVEEGSGRLDSGETRLRELGYKQELRREWGPAASFSGSLVFMAFTGGVTGAGFRPLKGFWASEMPIC